MPSEPAVAAASEILFQNTSGQAAIWEMNGTNIIGGGLVGPNPGPSWKAIGATLTRETRPADWYAWPPETSAAQERPLRPRLHSFPKRALEGRYPPN